MVYTRIKDSRGEKMNQNPEQKARDEIDKQLFACGWVLQNKGQINLIERTSLRYSGIAD